MYTIFSIYYFCFTQILYIFIPLALSVTPGILTLNLLTFTCFKCKDYILHGGKSLHSIDQKCALNCTLYLITPRNSICNPPAKIKNHTLSMALLTC